MYLDILPGGDMQFPICTCIGGSSYSMELLGCEDTIRYSQPCHEEVSTTLGIKSPRYANATKKGVFQFPGEKSGQVCFVAGDVIDNLLW
jgi:hypothetical protein